MQLHVEAVSISALGAETHVGKAAVSLLQAVNEFNTLKPFAIQLTYFDRHGTPLNDKGVVHLCGKLAATAMELFQLAQLQKAVIDQGMSQPEQILSAKRDPSVRCISGKVNLYIMDVKFEPTLVEHAFDVVHGLLKTSNDNLFHEPFVTISVGGHTLLTKK